MTMCAIGGIIATLVLPRVLKYIGMVNMYYLSSLLFGIALFSVVFAIIPIVFICITLIGLFINGHIKNKLHLSFKIMLKIMNVVKY